MKRLRTLKSFQIFKSEIKKLKTFSGWCPFLCLSNGFFTLRKIQSGRTVPLNHFTNLPGILLSIINTGAAKDVLLLEPGQEGWREVCQWHYLWRGGWRWWWRHQLAIFQSCMEEEKIKDQILTETKIWIKILNLFLAIMWVSPSPKRI